MKRKSGGGDDDDQFVVESARCSRFTEKVLRRCSCSSHPSSGTSTRLELVEEDEDRISKLPDHILVPILNRMMTNALGKKGEIEQVVRTSVLSRRWRFLWHQSLKSLIFTFSRRDSRYVFEEDSVCVAAQRAFVDRVNLILGLPVVGDTIDDFNLTFWLLTRHPYWSDHLPGWIGFAFQKRVKRLTINLEHLDKPTSLEHLENCVTLNDKLIRNHNMDSLSSLCLSRVDVSGGFLEHLLTICGSLQHLSVSYSATLVDFTVSGPCLKLKYLKIHCCFNLRRLCIIRVNLVSFDYDPALDTKHAVVVIEDAPCLINARLEFFKGKDKTAKVLSYLPRLQTLGLAFKFGWLRGPDLVFPKLTNLVKVELELTCVVLGPTICASLLASCPSVSELILEFRGLNKFYGDEEDKVARLKHPHECLKVVELIGFVGCKLDTGAALYLIENTLSLEKIVVDTSDPDIIEDTRSLAEQVEDHVCLLKLHKLSESQMGNVPESVSSTRADMHETDMRKRARARAFAREHLASRLSGTRTQLVLK